MAYWSGCSLLAKPQLCMKKKSNTNILPLLLLFLLSSLLPLWAQQPTAIKKQEPQWQERKFSEEKLQELKEDGRLDYPVVKVEDSWWTKFKRWFFMHLSEFFGGASRSGLLEIIIYAVFIGAGIFIIFRFLDIDLASMVKRSPAATPMHMREGITENIHELNFEQEISQAVQQQNFKKAVRLVYLASLKRLTDAGLLKWEPGKTNSQYQRELKSAGFIKSFGSLGYYFEYAWYGDFPVDEQLYRQVEQTYQQFSQQLEVKA